MKRMQGTDRPSDRALLVALNGAPGLARAALCRLGLEVEAWRDGIPTGGERDLAARFSISLDSLQLALGLRTGATAAYAAEEQAVDRLGGRIVTRLEADYPARLADLALPPPVLEIAGSSPPCFVTAAAARGTAESPAGPGAPMAPMAPVAPIAIVAIVGSRRATPYGLEVAAWLARELARQGVVVVSGFARGIDAAAHQGALSAEHGRTVGVLGCGLSVDYPKGHRELGLRIRSRGALVSEFPCALAPAAANFPVRNRIIAALAEVTVVVEAAAHSGSLITARLALELGREVLAVPGRITDEQALGVNDLLRDGAAPVTHPADILERLGVGTSGVGGFGDCRGADPAGALGQTRPLPELPPAQAALLAALDPARDLAVDSLAASAEIGIDVAVAALLELELAGWAVRVAGGGYRRGAP
ncbi:MAG: DNA-processing protein DprA [Thermoanaerobaculia bacterium]